MEHDSYRDRDGEPIVWHESVLDRSWDQLENEIDRKSQLDLVVDIHHIKITNVEMRKERLAALAAKICNGSATNSCTFVDFDNANLCEEGIVYLSKLIDFSSQLWTLYLLHNRIDNMDSAHCLSRSLKLHTCIYRIWLNHCDLGSTPEILLIILKSNVSIINLDNNSIDSLGAVTIAEYLEGDPPIEHLSLGHNQLNDDDAILISHTLKRNTNLRRIYLHSNKITSIGVKVLLTCVFDSSSLNALSESNHTLERIDFFDDDNRPIKKLPNYINKVNDFERFQWLGRTRKILLALQDKDSLLQYLANVPVKLMPEVLAFPLRRDANPCQHEHLNILYSTMR